MTTTTHVTARQCDQTVTVVLDLPRISEHDLSYDEIYAELQTIADGCQDEPGVERLDVTREHGSIIIEFEGDAMPPIMRRALAHVDLDPIGLSTARFRVRDR